MLRVVKSTTRFLSCRVLFQRSALQRGFADDSTSRPSKGQDEDKFRTLTNLGNTATFGGQMGTRPIISDMRLDPHPTSRQPVRSDVRIDVDASTVLHGKLIVPRAPLGLCIFCQGSGVSSFDSKFSIALSKCLEEEQIGSVMVDLLTKEERESRKLAFAISKLTDRLCRVAQWVDTHPVTKSLKTGMFGSFTGSSAMFRAAVNVGSKANVLACRFGRPGLATTEILRQITSPTMFIIGDQDSEKIRGENEMAMNVIATPTDHKKLVVLRDAFSNSEEDDVVEEMVEELTKWFARYLKADQ